MSTYSQAQRLSIPRYFPAVARAIINKVLVTGFTDTLEAAGVEFVTEGMANGYATIFVHLAGTDSNDTLSAAFAGCLAADSDCQVEYFDLGTTGTFEKLKESSFNTASLQNVLPEDLAEAPEGGGARPKLLVIGHTFGSIVTDILLHRCTMKAGPIETWGIGSDSSMYDHWYPGPDRSTGSLTGFDMPAADIICKNKTGPEHCFDIVALSLYSWNGSATKYQALIEWADQKLKPGGVLLIYGCPPQFLPLDRESDELFNHRLARPVVNIIVHRYENLSVAWTSKRHVVVMGTKKLERTRDDDMKELLIAALTPVTHNIDGTETVTAKAVLLPREATYSVVADPDLSPAIFSHYARPDYLERFVPETPFSLIQTLFKRNEDSKVPTLTVTPRLENLLKLNEYMRGVVKGPDGAWVITKGTSETCTTSFTDEDGNQITRQRKRIRQVFAYLTEPDTITSDGPRKGDIGIVDAG